MPRNNVKKYREKLYMTQSELASKMGVQTQTIGNIENGRNRPRVKTMRKLAEHLGAPIEELFPIEDDEEKPAAGLAKIA